MKTTPIAGSPADPDDDVYIGRSEVAMWMRVVSSWVCMLLYIWSLLAPVLLPDRYVHSLCHPTLSDQTDASAVIDLETCRQCLGSRCWFCLHLSLSAMYIIWTLLTCVNYQSILLRPVL